MRLQKEEKTSGMELCDSVSPKTIPMLANDQELPVPGPAGLIVGPLLGDLYLLLECSLFLTYSPDSPVGTGFFQRS